MPRYHFHVTDGKKLFDPKGVDLPDERAALHYGEQLTKGIADIAEKLGERASAGWHVQVTDEEGRVIARTFPKRVS